MGGVDSLGGHGTNYVDWAAMDWCLSKSVWDQHSWPVCLEA